MRLIELVCNKLIKSSEYYSLTNSGFCLTCELAYHNRKADNKKTVKKLILFNSSNKEDGSKHSDNKCSRESDGRELRGRNRGWYVFDAGYVQDYIVIISISGFSWNIPDTKNIFKSHGIPATGIRTETSA